MMSFVKTLNGCADIGQPWHSSGELIGTIYPSKTGAPFVTLISPGSHKFPKEAPELIVRFFKASGADAK